MAESLLAVLIPGQCRLCDQRLVRFTAAPVCGHCLDSLDPADLSLACSRCGQALENDPESNEADGCRHCRSSAPPFDAAYSFGIYRGDLRRLIHLLKYERMLPLAQPLADRMTAVLARFGPLDLLAPVPLHWSRRWHRGFNQSSLLAKHLAARNNLAFQPRALRRVRRTRTQAGLSDVERRENVRGAFAAVHVRDIVGRRILLVDDVMTTGATLGAAASALKAAGASFVGALTVARAEREAKVYR